MTDYNAFNPSTTITFVVKNNSSINRSIKVFNTRIAPGASLDLMKIPGVTEEDIRSELTKGSLKSLLAGKSLVVVSASVNFATTDVGQNAFLTSVGLSSTDTSNSTALTQTAWFIDPVNGSNTNDGATSATALKTFSELSRRWGVGNTLLPSNGPGGTVTVNILSSLPVDSSDPISFNVNMGNGASLNFQGSTPTTTPLTVTAVRTKNRATNTPWGLTLSGTAPATLLEARIRDQTTGALFYGLKDEGSSVLRISEPLTNSTGFPTNANRATPLNTDTFVVETAPSIQIGVITFNGGRETASVGTVRSVLRFFDFFMDGDVSAMEGSIVTTSLNRSNFPRSCFFPVCQSINVINCCTHAGGALTFEGGSLHWAGGATMTAAAGKYQLNNTTIIYDFDHIFQGQSVAVGSGSMLLLGTIGIFDSVIRDLRPAAFGLTDLDGSGLYVAGNGFVAVQVQGDTTSALWGSGNLGAGVNVVSGTMLYDNVTGLTVTGTAGDFKLGNQTANAFSYSATTAAPNPSVTCSWANLVTADGYPSGLFYPPKGAGIAKAT